VVQPIMHVPAIKIKNREPTTPIQIETNKILDRNKRPLHLDPKISLIASYQVSSRLDSILEPDVQEPYQIA
jgi:hypothetical protein